jgi:hypothetical protein
MFCPWVKAAQKREAQEDILDFSTVHAFFLKFFGCTLSFKKGCVLSMDSYKIYLAK